MSQQFDELVVRRVKMLDEARVMVLDPKAGAEEFQRATKMREEAALLGKRASELKEIEMAQDLMAHDLTSKTHQQAVSEFKDWQEYVGALKVCLKSKGGIIDQRFQVFEDNGIDLKAVQVKDMSGLSGAAGGFLIPVQQLTTVMGVAAPLSVVRRYATIIRTTQRQIKIPVVDQTGTTAGQPAFFGGMLVYWQEEASAATQSDGKFRQAELAVRELIGYTVFSNSLLADADPSLGDFLTGPLGFPGAIAWKEDYSFIRGSGVAEPRGLVSAPATKAITRTTSAHITYDDLVKMEAGFLGSDPIWIATQGAKAELMLMNGPSGNPLYLWGSARDGVPDTLLGHPIFFTDKQPALGTIGDIILADLKYYIILDRQAVSVDTSDQYKFGNNQTALRVIERVEGAPWLSTPITLSDGSTTVSPFVQIAT